METTKKDWLHFITGAVVAVIVSAAIVDAGSISLPPSDMLIEQRSCCCCCCKLNVDDEIIYTLEVQEDPAKSPIDEPPPRPVILSR